MKGLVAGMGSLTAGDQMKALRIAEISRQAKRRIRWAQRWRSEVTVSLHTSSNIEIMMAKQGEDDVVSDATKR